MANAFGCEAQHALLSCQSCPVRTAILCGQYSSPSLSGLQSWLQGLREEAICIGPCSNIPSQYQPIKRNGTQRRRSAEFLSLREPRVQRPVLGFATFYLLQIILSRLCAFAFNIRNHRTFRISFLFDHKASTVKDVSLRTGNK